MISPKDLVIKTGCHTHGATHLKNIACLWGNCGVLFSSSLWQFQAKCPWKWLFYYQVKSLPI